MKIIFGCRYLVYHLISSDCFFFFFQAEDGIRDTSVTGVQTCALPISPIKTCQKQSLPCQSRKCLRPIRTRSEIQTFIALRNLEGESSLIHKANYHKARSEERRVGKECRSWRSLYHYIKNKVKNKYKRA